MRSSIRNIITRCSLFVPILIYIGKRSYVAQDEGYYALQARWILEKGNWIAPYWWDDVVYDRTIGIQWFIALSQKLFGVNIFAAHIPSLIASIITLIFTYKISRILIGKNIAWSTPIILASTYLWVNNAHLATQDMPLLAFEILGIWSLITLKYHKNLKTSIIGFSLGFAFLMKSVMVLIPLIAITPYIIFYRKGILKDKSFWLSFIIGMMPLIIWICLSINEYGLEKVSLLLTKFIHLSTVNQFSKPYLYYFWNIPANTFPWGLISIIGALYTLKSKNNENKLILCVYPILFILLLTLFETKTQYYPLQLTPFIAINSSIAINRLIEVNQNLYKNILTATGIVLVTLGIYLIMEQMVNGFYYRNNFIPLSIITIGITWSISSSCRNKSKLILLTVIGPSLAFSLIVQSGLLTDRDPKMRELFESNRISNILETNSIDFVVPKKMNDREFSNLIKIALKTPNLGVTISPTELIKNNSYIWLIQTRKNGYIDNSNLNIIEKNDTINPWVLVKSEN